MHPVEVERLLIDPGAYIAATQLQDDLAAARVQLFKEQPPLAVEARRRYAWVRATLDRVETPGSLVASRGAALLEWINRPWPATVAFVLAMALVFQAVFA